MDVYNFAALICLCSIPSLCLIVPLAILGRTVLKWLGA